MDIVAIIAFRNEEPFLANCVRHLIRNGVRIAAIDNESTDGSKLVFDDPDVRPHLVAFDSVPHEGCYRWRLILEKKMQIAASLDADWIIHVDADEIMHSYREHETLAAAIARNADAGATVISMDEFVFLPLETSYRPDITDVQPLVHYYFYEPLPCRLMRAWKNQAGASMVESGGHIVVGGNQVLATETLVLRHYPFRDQAHAYEKYSSRRYSPAELAQGCTPQPHRLSCRGFQVSPRGGPASAGLSARAAAGQVAAAVAALLAMVMRTAIPRPAETTGCPPVTKGQVSG
jgi:Glycosyl transferase family 2